MDALLLLGLGILVLAALLFLLPGNLGQEQGSYCTNERSHMPDEFVSGNLVLSEELLRVRHPAKIVAKPDQVYRTVDGRLIPVENKARKYDRVYDSDRIEIGVQGFALRHGRLPLGARGAIVSSYGYIAIRSGDAPPRYHWVKSLDDSTVVVLRQRRLQVEIGQVPGAAGQPQIRTTARGRWQGALRHPLIGGVRNDGQCESWSKARYSLSSRDNVV